METPTFVEVTIERIVPGGFGLAHVEGLTLFVALAAPGDVTRVRIERVSGRVAFASIEEIIKPSALRVEPPCPYFGACGGCDFQQLSYQAQLDAKTEMIRDCLRRIGHIEQPPEISITPSPQQWHYRSRANWQFDPITKRLGYFESASHRVCDVEVCAVLAPRLQKVLEDIRSEIRNGSVADGLKDTRAVVGDNLGDDLGDNNVSVAPPLAGFQTNDVSLYVAGERYSFNADSFFQTNPDLLEVLVGEAIGNEKGKLAIDLYCGAGLFTLPLARRFERVIGIEVNDRATRFARRNLQNAQLQNAEVVTSSVGQWLKEHSHSLAPEYARSLESEHSRSFASLDFLLLDPPRAGAENIVIKGILDLHPRRISYVSCDPATLARDLKKLLAGGYSLESLVAFDMFPQTHHVETVTRLTDVR
jgi:tRNA/tmRNA/rRNA uracil-C5-methylase (TrmA/RlmC/RlmD family)